MGRHGSVPYPKELRDQAVRLVREWRHEHGRRDGGIREVANQSRGGSLSGGRAIEHYACTDIGRWLGMGADPEYSHSEVVSVKATDDGLQVRLRFQAEPRFVPLIPAGLVDDSDGWREVVELYSLVNIDSDGTYVFRTDEQLSEEITGRTLRFVGWWTLDAFFLVADTSRAWEQIAAPSPENHEHCMLDMVSIHSEAGDGTAWRSEPYWVCAPCYERYIAKDQLRVRRSA